MMNYMLIQRRYVMRSYDELKAEIESIQHQMVEVKKNERANALKEFGLTVGMLKDSLSEGRKQK